MTFCMTFFKLTLKDDLELDMSPLYMCVSFRNTCMQNMKSLFVIVWKLLIGCVKFVYFEFNWFLPLRDDFDLDMSPTQNMHFHEIDVQAKYEVWVWVWDFIMVSSHMMKSPLICCVQGWEYRRLQYGHVVRSSSCIKSVTNMEVPCSKARGRPRKTWSDCVKADMNACSIGGIDPQNRTTKQNRLEIRY